MTVLTGSAAGAAGTGGSWIPETVPDAPLVPPWVTGDWAHVNSTAAAYTAAGQTFAQVRSGLLAELADTAVTLGWRSDAAGAASARAGRSGDVLDRAASALANAGSALSILAGRGTQTKALVEDARSRRALLVDDGQTNVARAGLKPLLGGGTLVDPATAEQVAALDRQVRDALETLIRVDAACRPVLEQAADELRLAVRQAAQDGWVESVTTAAVDAVLSAFHVVPDAAERAVLARVRALPDTPDGLARLRSELSTLSSRQLEQLLLAHPELAARLAAHAGDLWLASTPGVPPVWSDPVLQALMTSGPTESAAVAELLRLMSSTTDAKQRIADVRAWFAALQPEQARTIALLYPGFVGNLNGVPLDLRVTANRVAVAGALHTEQARLADHLEDAADQGYFRTLWSSAVATDGARSVYTLDNPDSRLADAQKRIAYYQRLLDEQFPDPARRPGGPVMVGHQVLYFNPDRDGQIAEMFGTIDAGTGHVGVFVPGTTARLATAPQYAQQMADIARTDITGRTTTIMWMGFDEPNAIAADAPDPSYAREGGPALRDFLWGLDLPSTTDSTVIGHSYGGAVVGVAEKYGLETDRVVMLESAGLGHDVYSVADYGPNSAHIQHYTMTAPGDPIGVARVPPHWTETVTGIGHGGNPDTTPGFTRLETGRLDDNPAGPKGDLIHGFSSHVTVNEKGTTAWWNLAGVITGGHVTVWTPPTTTVVDRRPDGHGGTMPVYRTTYPYADPGFSGPQIDVPPAGQQVAQPAPGGTGSAP